MNTRRKLIVALGAGALAPLACIAQPATIARIGYLSAETESSLAPRFDSLRAGLRELGYIEGKNLFIEVRRADGNYARLPDLAAELVRLKVDLIVAEGLKAGLAATRATASIPIVLPASADPIATGVVRSLARPGGNVTGSAVFATELAVKRLELLKEANPRITKVAFLFNPFNPISKATLRELEAAASTLKLQLRPFEVSASSEFNSVFAAIAKGQSGAVLVQGDTIFDSRPEDLARLAAAHRLPSAGRIEVPEGGGLIGYGVNSPELYRRSASIVDRILKGAKPGDLPIDRATVFELVINLKTAKALGIKIPNSILVRATKVIE